MRRPTSRLLVCAGDVRRPADLSIRRRLRLLPPLGRALARDHRRARDVRRVARGRTLLSAGRSGALRFERGVRRRRRHRVPRRRGRVPCACHRAGLVGAALALRPRAGFRPRERKPLRARRDQPAPLLARHTSSLGAGLAPPALPSRALGIPPRPRRRLRHRLRLALGAGSRPRRCERNRAGARPGSRRCSSASAAPRTSRHRLCFGSASPIARSISRAPVDWQPAFSSS